MKTTFFSLAASLAVATAALTGCAQETPGPTEATVRLAVIPGAEHGGRPFSTALTQEVTTAPVWSGDPNGTGFALVTLNFGRREICWQISVEAIALPATSSHIHRAGPGIRGERGQGAGEDTRSSRTACGESSGPGTGR